MDRSMEWLATRLGVVRPLAFIDCETTGRNPERTRLIDLAAQILQPGGSLRNFYVRVHPGIPIPESATKIHGITDRDVAGCQPFAAVASTIAGALEGADLVGYNVEFDIRVLAAEMRRAKMPWSVDGREVIDPFRLWQKREPRDLGAAHEYFCGHALGEHHRAAADVDALVGITIGQLLKWKDLPTSVPELAALATLRDPTWLDRQGKIRWEDGEARIAFGNKAGVSLRELVQRDRGFLSWILDRDFEPDTKAIVRAALGGRFPSAPPDC